MKASRNWIQAAAMVLAASAIGMGAVPRASAEPDDADQIASASSDAQALPASSAVAIPQADSTHESDDATSTACHQFNLAVNYASINYEDFADFSAGDGNYVDYGDPTVQNANVAGRTALRQAASAALSASGIPGVPGDISAPMQAWSMKAAKLVLVMGIRGGGDTLNSTATELNTDAHQVQMACAAAGAGA